MNERRALETQDVIHASSPDLHSWNLSDFTGRGYQIGRPIVVQALWMLVSTTIFMRWWLPSSVRVALLRLFGASIGEHVLLRHRVRVHWPWKLTVHDNVWIGEGAWLLNLEHITIEPNVCISQDVLICTGSHDRRSSSFEFDNSPITIHESSWIAARAIVLAGSRIGPNSVVPAGSCVRGTVGQGVVHTSKPSRT